MPPVKFATLEKKGDFALISTKKAEVTSRFGLER
jgi:hypothetical protein